MPTGTPNAPFAPRGQLSRELLLAYAEGRLSPSEQREVESHLEHDPLLQEAMEGLRMPGAVGALEGLRPPAAVRGRSSVRWALGGGALVLAVVLTWWAASRPDAVRPAEVSHTLVPPGLNENTLPAAAPLQAAEIAAAVEIPESLHIGHDVEERPMPTVMDTTPVQRVHDVGPMDNRERPVERPVDAGAPIAPRAKRTSVQLLYLHDLKLVDPKELYAKDLLLRVEGNGVDASHADRAAREQERRTMRNMTYTSFMDAALAKFAENDHRGCLDELRFLLDQYPDDVNARFYAGLCCYNLGLYKRARTFLHQAATDPLGVFDEEATWYHALTLDRLGEHESAREAFTRIAAANGFYAERARKELGRL